MGDEAFCVLQPNLSGKHEAISVAAIINKPMHAGQNEIEYSTDTKLSQ